VSEQAAAVIYNSTRFEQTQHEFTPDPLTTLPNRRSLDRQFETGWRARPVPRPASASSSSISIASRKSTTPTATRRAIGAARGRAVAAVDGPRERWLRALCRRRVHRRAVGLQPETRRVGGRRAECGERLSLRAAPGRPRRAVDQRGPGPLPGGRKARSRSCCWGRAEYATSGPPLTDSNRHLLAQAERA